MPGWHGSFSSAVVKKESSRKKKQEEEPVLKPSYAGPIPISTAKYKDIQMLMKFCSSCNHEFFNTLPHLGNTDSSAADKLSDVSEAGESDTDEYVVWQPQQLTSSVMCLKQGKVTLMNSSVATSATDQLSDVSEAGESDTDE
ncbi:hypothetical protein PoB_005571900 [Plakobranchus ocellatus]|uniref:Uncharacterized protein n=1 Tax=Plakobranchus ocellatus TaxID=259542 RepID=A0AAV4CDK5_9GAST|nr:hypothetical protein PoB_005571900 [Plakobranchus ocellatus]